MVCERPTVLVGGELTLEMLELQLNPATKFYVAPVQMKANNGVLIIDDFGRQRMRPEELLNRWVVPLDRRVDFLSMAGGKQVEIPFEMFVVFATNLSPATLVDAAFLRRIQTKIEVGAISDTHFHQIFRGVCDELKVSYDAVIVDELVDVIRNKLNEPLRACHPRDIVNQICWAARYESRVPTLTHQTLMAAIDAYFSDKRRFLLWHRHDYVLLKAGRLPLLRYINGGRKALALAAALAAASMVPATASAQHVSVSAVIVMGTHRPTTVSTGTAGRDTTTIGQPAGSTSNRDMRE